MTCKSLLLKVFIVLSMAVLPAMTAHAAPVLTLSTLNQAGEAGEFLDFFGTITNSGSSTINVTEITASVQRFDIFFTDTDPFYFNPGFSTAPNSPGYVLAPGASSGQILLFSVFVFENANVTSQGSVVVFTLDGVASNRVNFSVTAVPEPTTMLLLGTGLTGAVLARQRKRRKQKLTE